MKIFCSPFAPLDSVWAVWIWLAGTASLLAHDPGLSTVDVRLGGDTIEVTLVLAARDAATLVALDADRDGAISASDFIQGKAELTERAVAGLEILLDEQRGFLEPIRCDLDDGDNITVRLRARAASFSKLHFRSRGLASLPHGHRQFLRVRSANGTVLTERLLSSSADDMTIEEAGGATPTTVPAARSSFRDFLCLGLKHILTGYDHLLFVFSLLLVCRGYAAAAKIITCFTVAHSITLALATFAAIQVPSRVVEPLIAASIVFVALENLVRGEAPKNRLPLVFGFGLVHGLGFASVLRERGVGSGAAGVALPLFSFNLGVELGQLLLAALLLPAFRTLDKHPLLARRCIPASSVAVALAGVYWLIQRLGCT